MYIDRLAQTAIKKSKKSVLLLGPRQTGKSTLIKNLAPDLSINLARESEFLEFSSQPDLLEKILSKSQPKPPRTFY
jgi:predicted AAA+ superfamily ATPase